MIPKCNQPEDYPYYCHALKQWSDSWTVTPLHGKPSLLNLPQLPGLYGLIIKNWRGRFVWLYIGETFCLRARWHCHHRWSVVEALLPRPLYITYWSLPRLEPLDQVKIQLREIERELIKARKPLLNNITLVLDKPGTIKWLSLEIENR
jgi:hypothetical protein